MIKVVFNYTNTLDQGEYEGFSNMKEALNFATINISINPYIDIVSIKDKETTYYDKNLEEISIMLFNHARRVTSIKLFMESWGV